MCAILGICAAPGVPASRAQGITGADSVVALLEVTGAQAAGAVLGSGFFIASSGAVLTNAHVVLGAENDPGRYRLIALWRGEWFSASVACASPLPYRAFDPAQKVSPRRDVAELELGQAFTARNYEALGRQWRPHTGALPAFPTLWLAPADPAPGQEVATPGYGAAGRPPTLTVKRGRVLALFMASDGTPVVAVDYARRGVQHGDSGAPILDGAGDVVGMQTWVSASHPGEGAGIAQSALRNPCR